MIGFHYVNIVLCQRYGTTGGIKQTRMHNRSENGRSAWVVLCATLTHIDTVKDLS
jgi:hypothetical protein